MKRILIIVALLATGCAHQVPESKFPALDQHLDNNRNNYVNGSLWQNSAGGIVEDFKARSKGDIITIVISETASASKVATTDTSRASSVAAGIPNLLGLETTAVSKWMNLSQLVNASTTNTFDGKGSTTRIESLNATISARIIDVLSNGNMLIEGHRNVMVNNEDQIVILTGTVRPRDISTDNTVSSSSIADARITYSGKGIITDRQEPGWLMGLMDKFWPF